MIHAHIDETKTVPLWAALGAPLLGVPLMVAALALVAPTTTGADGAETGGTDPVEVVQPVEQAADVREDCVGPLTQSG